MKSGIAQPLFAILFLLSAFAAFGAPRAALAKDAPKDGEAREAFNQGSMSRSDFGHLKQGLEFRRLNNLEQAVGQFDQCKQLELAPDWVIDQIAASYLSLGQTTKALPLMQKVVTRIGNNNKRMIAASYPYPLEVRSDCYNALGKLDLAAADDIALAAILPSGGKMYLIKAGDTLRHAKKYVEAIAIFDRALKGRANPDDVFLLISRGSCLQALQKWNEGVSNYSEAIKLASQPGRTNKKATFWALTSSYAERAKCYDHLGNSTAAATDRKLQEKMSLAVEDELFTK